MRAVKAAANYMLSSPKAAWADYKLFKKTMNTDLNEKIFSRSFAYMSRDCSNVYRDWEKVTKYCKRLGVVGQDFKPNMSNEYLSWEADDQPEDGQPKQIAIAKYQRDVAAGKGILEGHKPSFAAVGA